MSDHDAIAERKAGGVILGEPADEDAVAATAGMGRIARDRCLHDAWRADTYIHATAIVGGIIGDDRIDNGGRTLVEAYPPTIKSGIADDAIALQQTITVIESDSSTRGCRVVGDHVVSKQQVGASS